MSTSQKKGKGGDGMPSGTQQLYPNPYGGGGLNNTGNPLDHHNVETFAVPCAQCGYRFTDIRKASSCPNCTSDNHRGTVRD